MSMSKGLKIGLISGAVLLIGGIASYFIFRKPKPTTTVKKPATGSGNIFTKAEALTADVLNLLKANSHHGTLPMSYIQAEDKNNSAGVIAVQFAAPRPAVGTLNTGDTVAIKNTDFDGSYKVLNTWTDDAGKLGAIYISASPDLVDDGTNATKLISVDYENVGTINF